MSSPTLNDIYERLGELTSEVRSFREEAKDHETRLRAIELIRNWCAGVIAAAAASFGLIKGAGVAIASMGVRHGG